MLNWIGSFTLCFDSLLRHATSRKVGRSVSFDRDCSIPSFKRFYIRFLKPRLLGDLGVNELQRKGGGWPYSSSYFASRLSKNSKAKQPTKRTATAATNTERNGAREKEWEKGTGEKRVTKSVPVRQWRLSRNPLQYENNYSHEEIYNDRHVNSRKQNAFRTKTPSAVFAAVFWVPEQLARARGGSTFLWVRSDQSRQERIIYDAVAIAHSEAQLTYAKIRPFDSSIRYAGITETNDFVCPARTDVWRRPRQPIQIGRRRTAVRRPEVGSGEGFCCLFFLLSRRTRVRWPCGSQPAVLYRPHSPVRR